MGLEVSKVSHDTKEINFNYSSHNSSKSEKSLVCKCLNFAIPRYELEYSDYLLPFELFYRVTFNDLDLPNEKLIFLKAKIKDCASSSLKSYNGKGTVSNLNKDEIPFWKHYLKIMIWLYKSEFNSSN